MAHSVLALVTLLAGLSGGCRTVRDTYTLEVLEERRTGPRTCRIDVEGWSLFSSSMFATGRAG